MQAGKTWKAGVKHTRCANNAVLQCITQKASEPTSSPSSATHILHKHGNGAEALQQCHDSFQGEAVSGIEHLNRQL